MPAWLSIELGILMVALPLLTVCGGWLMREFRSLHADIADLRVKLAQRATRTSISELHSKIDGVASELHYIRGWVDRGKAD